MNKSLWITIVCLLSLTVISFAETLSDLPKDDTKQVASLRKGVPLNEVSNDPAILQNASNKDIKRTRAYPMQPPSIPHKTDGYQIDLKANKCLSCHSRTRTEESQAPMVSVTHFMNRDGNFLADVSPRRYFCTQCHVTQIERKPLIKNDFMSVDKLMREASE